MVGLVCKFCGSNDFVNEGDFFVCQYCGSKYTSDEAVHAIADPFLELAFGVIARAMSGILGISDDDFEEAKTYLTQAEDIDPGNWKLWFYKGIIEELVDPTLFMNDAISSFSYFDNAMKYADDITISSRILPVIDRFKQLHIDYYIRREGSGWFIYNYYPIFLREFVNFYNKYDIATAYVQKTSDEWDSLSPIVEKQQAASKERVIQGDLQHMKETLTKMNQYKNRMIGAIAEIRLYPAREAKLKELLGRCGFFEIDKKRYLEQKIRDLNQKKKDAEETVDRIKTKAYLLMKNSSSSPPARSIWEETFVRVVSDYVEKCYIYKEKPEKKDKDELNAKLFPIGFGFEYYLPKEE